MNNQFHPGENLRGADLRGEDLSGADLREADLRGADLRDADLRGADLREADLTGADMRGADLRGADLRDADLTAADLCGANLARADLAGADMCGVNLLGPDLREAGLTGACLIGAVLPSGIPAVENIHRAIWAAARQPGALDMGAWHGECGSTHCRGGWAITLAGDAGRELMERLGASLAATLIYAASDRDLAAVPDWHASDADALADMERLASA